MSLWEGLQARQASTDKHEAQFSYEPHIHPRLNNRFISAIFGQMFEHCEAGYRALRKGRYSASSNVYLVTTVTDRRIAWFRDSRLAIVMARSLAAADKSYETRTVCWVVMPDHIHWLVQLGDVPLEKTVNGFKGASARAVNAKLKRRGRFWFPGFHERALRKEENLRKAARYVVANPLRAGLVSRLGDYPFWDAVWL